MIKIRRSGKFGRQMIGTGHRRSWRSRFRVLGAVLAISALVVLVGGSATASAVARVVNGAAQIVPGTSDLDGIACRGHDNCVAVGTAGPNPDEGVVVPITDGTPGGVQTVIGPGQPGAPDAVTLQGIGCSSANSCLAGGMDTYMGGVIVPIKRGNAGNEESEFFGSVNGVACLKIRFCIPVGIGDGTASVLVISYGKVQNEGGPTGAGLLNAVSCRSTTWCLVAGTNGREKKGVVALVTNNAPGSAVAVSGSSLLKGVACRPATVECLVVGYNSSNEGVVAGINDGIPGAAQVVSGAEGLLGVACPTNSSCLVVGTTVGKHSLKGVLAMIHLPPR